MFGKALRRVRTILGMTRVDDEIRRELEFHIAMESERRQRAGLSAEEARRATLVAFGGVGRVREDVRDARGMTFWDTLVQDLRFGVRTLRRSPGFTVAAVLILALGIGANTAIFSVIDGVLLKPLPFREGGDLVLIQQAAPASNVADAGVSIPELFDYRARLQSIRDLVEYHGMPFTLLNQGEPDRVDTGVVSANFFEMLGIKPLLGRTFVQSDDALEADAVLVLSNEYWQSKFGGDAHVIGRVLQMNNRPHTIVGVLPAFPQYPRKNDVYMPTSACPFRSASERAMPGNGHRAFPGLRVFGRLAPGADEEKATGEVASVAATFSRDYPKDYQRAQNLSGRAHSLEDQLVFGARPMLLALGGTTVLVLLIACANVANLALARTVRRKRELALRTALGADRRRLLRQLVTESVIVALIGGALGFLLAWLSLDSLVGFVGRFTARTGQITMDAGVLTFTLAVSVFTGVVFGAAPALAARRDVAQSMREGGAQTGEGGGRHRLRSALVVAQVAVSFILLVGAALLLQSFHRLSSVALGYDTDHVMTASIFGNFSHQTTPEDAVRDGSEILDRLRAQPGVRSAALTSAVPLSNLRPTPQTIQVEGRTDTTARSLDADQSVASDGYFATLSVPLVSGRDFRASDDATAPPVAIVNTSMATFWNGADPVGSRFAVSGTDTWITVVGVVGDFRVFSADREVIPQYYTPFRQSGGAGGGLIMARADGNPGDLVKPIKTAVHSVDDQIPVKNLSTLAELRDGRLAAPRLTAVLLSIFAAVALVVSLAGVTGVIATSVSQRTREFGLRMALGASRSSVLQQVLGQAVTLVVVGLSIGAAGAYAFSRIISQLLFATTPTDVLVYASVAALFVVVSLVACVAPARRATTIDPLLALRAE